MPPLASRASGQEHQAISPELMIAIVALFVIFLVIIIGFCLPTNKKCYSFSAFDRSQCGPETCQHAAAHHHPPTRRGLTHPVASIRRYPACKSVHRMADKASRGPQESIRSPATPSPYYCRRAPTGVFPARAWSGRSASSVPPSPAPPTTRPSPSLGYAARGPTATVRPVVW